MIRDPQDVPLEEKIRTVKIARKMLENMVDQYLKPEDGQTVRDYRRAVLDPWEAAKARRETPRPAPKTEHLAQAVAEIRSPEEQRELEQALAEARAYRGQGRRG
jgi:hypothetical protein